MGKDLLHSYYFTLFNGAPDVQQHNDLYPPISYKAGQPLRDQMPWRAYPTRISAIFVDSRSAACPVVHPVVCWPVCHDTPVAGYYKTHLNMDNKSHCVFLPPKGAQFPGNPCPTYP